MKNSNLHQQIKTLSAELDTYLIRVISAKDFTPHKVAYWQERAQEVQNKINLLTK